MRIAQVHPSRKPQPQHAQMCSTDQDQVDPEHPKPTETPDLNKTQ